MDHHQYEHHDFLHGYENRPACIQCDHTGGPFDNHTCLHQTFAKILVIGDQKVGKTCLCLQMVRGSIPLPGEYVPNAFESYSKSVKYEENNWLHLKLLDCRAKDDFDRTPSLDYPGTTLFLLCFSVVRPSSYERVETRWFKEIDHYVPGVPHILVGTQSDLRDDPRTLRRLEKKGKAPITQAEIDVLKYYCKPLAYIEVSSLTGDGVHHLLATALGYAADPSLQLVGPPPRIPLRPVCPVKFNHHHKRSSRINISQMLGNPEFSDIKIKFGSQEVFAHKIILAAGSPKMRKLIKKKSHVTLEANIGHVSTMRWLQHIYAGDLPAGRQLDDEWLAHPEDYKQTMNDLLAEGSFSDITVKTHSGDLFKVHKIFLKANSTLFEAVLDPQNNLCTELLTVPLHQLLTKDFRIVLAYLYGMPLELTTENVFQIIEVANKCLIADLEETAMQFVHDHFKDFDPFDVCLLSHQLGLHKLKSFVVWWFQVNYQAQKSNTEGWKKLPEDLRQQIQKGCWPPEPYLDAKADWDSQRERSKSRKRTKNEKCLLQ